MTDPAEAPAEAGDETAVDVEVVETTKDGVVPGTEPPAGLPEIPDIPDGAIAHIPPGEVVGPDAQEDMDGSPSYIEEKFLKICFQLGSTKLNGVNGTTIEHVIETLIARLEGFQSGPLGCSENVKAIARLNEGLNWLK